MTLLLQIFEQTRTGSVLIWSWNSEGKLPKWTQNEDDFGMRAQTKINPAQAKKDSCAEVGGSRTDELITHPLRVL